MGGSRRLDYTIRAGGCATGSVLITFGDGLGTIPSPKLTENQGLPIDLRDCSDLTYFIGTRWLPEPQTRADHGGLLRTIGFSSAPGLIRVLGIIPGLRGIVFSVAGIWMLVAMVIAVRQALDYKSTWRAIGVCVIGWVIQGVVLVIAVSMFRGS